MWSQKEGKTLWPREDASRAGHAGYVHGPATLSARDLPAECLSLRTEPG